MSETGFTINGMDDFKRNLVDVLETYTDTSEKHLKRIGNKLKRTAKENTPESPYEHKKKLKKSWKSKVEGLDGKDLEYKLRNAAPHYHLVERGHVQKTPGGRITGFVQGKHFFDKAFKEFEQSGFTEKEIERFMKDTKKKVERQ